MASMCMHPYCDAACDCDAAGLDDSTNRERGWEAKAETIDACIDASSSA
jgi:hypothetical protein